MRFKTYFKSASFLLTFSAFLSLIFTGEIAPPYSMIAVISMAFALQERYDLSALSRSMVIVAIPFLALDFFILSGDVLLAFTHFLMLLTSARMVSLKTNSDYNQLYLLTFFELLASSALTINFSFAFTFVLYLVSITWVLLLFHIKKEVEEHGEQGRGLESTVTLPFFLGIGGVAVVSLVITLAIFFVLPRAGIGFFYKKPGKVLKTTGFGDKVDFGSVGPVTLDPTTVMRVELPDYEKGLGAIYLRGSVMDFFNGISWEKERHETISLERSGFDFFLYKGTEPLVRQEIILDPIDSRVIFGMSRIVKLSGRFQRLFKDPYDAVYLPFNPSTRFQYTVYSDTKMPGSSELESDKSPYPADILEFYTRTPALSERVRNTVATLTVDAKSPYQKVERIMGYLSKNYVYTLSPGRDISLPPIEDFLFVNKGGYCDHFSTTMAVLLREAKVPTRLVTGYMTSEWNDLGRFYTVRQRNAHSWVEVYFPSFGWVPFEPTPPSAPTEEDPVTSAMSRYVGYMRLKWDRYIINFTFQDQLKAAREARKRTESGSEALLGLVKSLRAKVRFKGIAIPASILAVLLLSYVLLRRKQRARGSVMDKMGTVSFYREMLLILAGKGLTRPDGVTPREFAERVLYEKGGPYSGVLEVTKAFEKLRYGSITIGHDEMDSINRILEGMRKL